ncbi:MAG: trypsin-like peptidase domain-containing protein [Conexivisphaerales archaeon]
MSPQSSTSTSSKLVAILIIGIIAGSAAGAIIGYSLAQRNFNSQVASLNGMISALQGEVNTLSSQISAGNSYSNITGLSDLTQLYNSVKDSVVVVEGIVPQTVIGFFGPVQQYEMVQGSGFVYYYNGQPVIITNYHVVNGAQNITVTFYNGVAYNARVLGTDPYSDLAVLHVNGTVFVQGLTIVSSRSVQVGEPVVAIGSPFGLAGSMTFGIISQVGRTITESITNGYPIADVLQFSAPINPGNSGGPLLDTSGDVIGITTAEVSNSQGLGFAIPADTILRELPSLIATGSYNMHPYLGIGGTDMTPYIATAIGVNVTYGWLVESVAPNSPAAKAGIIGGNKTVNTVQGQIVAGGDIILAINGTRVTDGDVLSSYLEQNTLPGQTVVLTLLRDGRIINVNVTLGERPPP